MLAYLAYILSWRRLLMVLVIPTFAILWLIFFPNAPYILTDLQHLGQASTNASLWSSANVPLWYDVILLVWFSWTGMLLGIVSLNLMQEIIRREFGRWFGWLFVFSVAGLSSAGIYVGRFIRLNSGICCKIRPIPLPIFGIGFPIPACVLSDSLACTRYFSSLFI